jgi:hypothetical protein
LIAKSQRVWHAQLASRRIGNHLPQGINCCLIASATA